MLKLIIGSTKEKFLPGLLLMAILILTIGCTLGYNGRLTNIERNQVEVIQIGVTTKAEILDKFKEPQKIVHKPDGIEIYVYIHSVDKALFIPLPLSLRRTGAHGQTLAISFQDGVVIDYTFTIDQRGLS